MSGLAAIASLAALLLGAFGSWQLRKFLRQRRRTRQAQPLQTADRELLLRRMPLFRALPQERRLALERKAQVLLAEKTFEGCNGLQVSSEMRLLVAAHAALPILEFDDYFYPDLDVILLYPEAFYVEVQDDIGEGLAVRRREVRAGESWHDGALVLSWDDVEESLVDLDGANVILHEFAHQLDQANGQTDGVPLLAAAADYVAWREAMSDAYLRLKAEVEKRRPTHFDPYAAEHPAEFFAVLCEEFFECPAELQAQEPAVYQCLTRFFGWSPAVEMRS